MITQSRRRVNDSESYIKDGLIFWIDAIWNNDIGKHVNGVSSWKDLTNIHTTTGTVEFIDNYANFTGTEFIYFVSNEIINAINNDTCTIEMLLKPISKGTASNSMYIQLGSSKRGFWIWDNSNYCFSAFSYKNDSYLSVALPWNKSKKWNRLILSGNTLSINNTQINCTSTGQTENSDCYIGGTNTIGGCAVFELYSVRIYNRILTQQELLYNWNTDQKRFEI